MRRHVILPAPDPGADSFELLRSALNGGERANIIPVFSECTYTVRSQNLKRLEQYNEMLRTMAEGAAMMTGTKMEFTTCKSCPPTCYNMPLADAFLDSMEKPGGKIYRTQPHKGFLGATDFGIFSRMRPGCHLHFPIMATDVAHHTEGFHLASGRQPAVDNMFAAGKSMAETALKFLSDPKFRSAVEEAFAAVLAED